MLRRLLAWLELYGLELHDLDARTLDGFLALRRLAPESRHRYLLIFTELYQHLAVLRDEESNPARELLTAERAPERASPEALTPQETRQLLATLTAARKEGWKSRRLTVLICLLLGAGLRTKELLGLRSRDVDLQRSTLWVKAHKPRPERTIPISGICRQALQDWLPYLANLRVPGGLLVPGTLAGAPLSASTLFRQVQALLAKAAIERRYEGPMLLRNTRAAAWLAVQPSYKVADWLGHEHERTTELLLEASQAWIGQPLLEQELDRLEAHATAGV